MRSQTESLGSVDACHGYFDSVRMYDSWTGRSTHVEWQIKTYMWDEFAFNCEILQGREKNVWFLWIVQTVLHYFDNMKSKSTPLLTIINVPGLVEHYSSVHIILKRGKKKRFCHRCGLLGNAYAPPRRFVVLMCGQLDLASSLGHILILHNNNSVAFLFCAVLTGKTSIKSKYYKWK